MRINEEKKKCNYQALMAPDLKVIADVEESAKETGRSGH